MSVTRLPGFRDFYPDDLAQRNHICAVWREVAARYGFVEYDGPPIESLELYTRKSGEEIEGQLYGFTDRGGREVALRPEMTPTFARMVAARAGGLPKPIKWFSIPQLFRYERPQKGRLREHLQLNLDIVGEESAAADAEVVAAAIDVLRAFGLGSEDFVARVSDRRLMTGVLMQAGARAEDVTGALAALDKLDRESEEWVVDRLGESGISAGAAGGILNAARSDLEGLAERYAGHAAIGSGVERLRHIFGHLESAGLAAYAEFDARLVRGLAYYTGVVFELWDRRGRFRAICGGGRYDGLLAAVGGPELPALGFGMGDVVLGELLRDRGLFPAPAGALDDFVVYVTDDQRPLALKIVHALREQGRRVAYDYRGRAVGRQFKLADQQGAVRTIVVGPDEAARGEVLVRRMDTGEETAQAIGGLLETGE